MSHGFAKMVKKKQQKSTHHDFHVFFMFFSNYVSFTVFCSLLSTDTFVLPLLKERNPYPQKSLDTSKRYRHLAVYLAKTLPADLWVFAPGTECH